MDQQRFRAVIDTGSPFLLVDGFSTCSRERWGCYRDDGGVKLGDYSTEQYGGQDIDVEWRRGSLQLAGYKSDRDATNNLGFRRLGARAGFWTSPDSSALALIEPINFGVIRGYTGRGGSGAVYLGLAKARLPRIRPTFLEQTQFERQW